MAAIEIAQGLYWVGVLDPDIRIFDVIMSAPHGTTYNAYLVRGEKTALVDLTKPGFEKPLLGNIEALTDPADIDYLVLNHTEPDHAGVLDYLLGVCNEPRVVCSKSARQFVQHLLNRDVDPLLVEDGHTLDLGGKMLRFVGAPFLHWPDTMFTYAVEDRALMPCDFLGAHHCDERMFADLVDDYSHQFKYYFDVIMRPFKEYALKALDRIDELDIAVVCPSHGPIVRRDIAGYLQQYRQWCSPALDGRKRLMVFYASSYGNTQRMAHEIAAGAQAAGATVALHDLKGADIATYIGDFERADGVAVGSLTINGDAVKPVWDLLSSLATLKLRGKVGAAFGSYVWSGEAPQMIYDRLKNLKLRMVGEPLRAHFVPTADDLRACRELGGQLAVAIGAAPQSGACAAAPSPGVSVEGI